MRAASQDRWAAAHCHVLGRLFSICGAAGATCDDDELALALTSLAGRVAWHAELLSELVVARDGAELVAAPAPGADDVLDRLARLGASDEPATCALLARVVLPRLLVAFARERASTDARTHGPRARACTLVARDLAEARAALEAIAERLLGAEGLASAVRQRSEAERELAEAGVAHGFVAGVERSEGLTAPVE